MAKKKLVVPKDEVETTNSINEVEGEASLTSNSDAPMDDNIESKVNTNDEVIVPEETDNDDSKGASEESNVKEVAVFPNSSNMNTQELITKMNKDLQEQIKPRFKAVFTGEGEIAKSIYNNQTKETLNPAKIMSHPVYNILKNKVAYIFDLTPEQVEDLKKNISLKAAASHMIASSMA